MGIEKHKNQTNQKPRTFGTKIYLRVYSAITLLIFNKIFLSDFTNQTLPNNLIKIAMGFLSIKNNDNHNTRNPIYSNYLPLKQLLFIESNQTTYDKYANLRTIPDISYSKILATSFLPYLQSTNQINPLHELTCKYLDKAIQCYEYVGNYSFLSYRYIKHTQIMNIDELDYDYIPSETNPDDDWITNQKDWLFGIPNEYYKDLSRILGQHHTPVYLIPYESAPYKFGKISPNSEQDMTAGVFGFAPNSTVWDWIAEVYYSTYDRDTQQFNLMENEIYLSIHYQNEDPDNDQIKELATGKYDRYSGMVQDGQDGIQDQIWFNVDPNLAEIYWALDQVNIEIIGWVGVNICNICFTTINDDLILVKNPEIVINALSQELCPTAKYPSECNQELSQNHFYDERVFFRFSKDSHIFEFKASHFVSFDNNNNAKYWISDLQTLIDQQVCDTSATLAVGKRFLRYMELSLKKDQLSNSNNKISLNWFKKNDEGILAWTLILSITFGILVIFVISAFLKILIKKEFFISYLKIKLSKSLQNFDNSSSKKKKIISIDNLIIEDEEKGIKYLSQAEANLIKANSLNLTTVKYETRLVWIHLSKYMIFTPLTNLFTFGLIIWVCLYSYRDGGAIYIGTYILIQITMWYMILVLIGSVKRFRQIQTFCDAYHTHYYMKNMTMFLIKVGVLFYMIYDFLYPNFRTDYVFDIAYLPAIAVSLLWNFFIYKNRISIHIMLLFLLRDVVEDACIYTLWQNYQNRINATIALIPLCTWYGSWFIEFICYRKEKGVRSKFNGKHLTKSAFLCSQLGNIIQMGVIIVLAQPRLDQRRLNQLYIFILVQLIISFCYCCFGFIDNDVNPFSLSNEKYKEVFQLVFSVGDRTKEFYDNFLVINKKYLDQQKKLTKNNNWAININPFNFNKKIAAKNVKYLDYIFKNQDFREPNLKKYSPSQYDKARNDEFYNLIGNRSAFVTDINDRLSTFVFQRKKPDHTTEAPPPQELDYEPPTRKVKVITAFHKRFKKKVFEIECDAKYHSIQKIHGDSKNRFIYVLRANYTGSWTKETLQIYDLHKGLKHKYYYNRMNESETSQDLSKDQFPLALIRVIHYFKDNDTFLCFKISNAPSKLTFLLLKFNSDNKLEILNDFNKENLEFEVPRKEPVFGDFFQNLDGLLAYFLLTNSGIRILVFDKMGEFVNGYLNLWDCETIERKIWTIKRVSNNKIEARGRFGHRVCYFLIEIDEGEKGGDDQLERWFEGNHF